MNLNYDEARSLFSDLKSIVYKDERTELIVSAPTAYLSQFSTANISSIKLAAQNCHYEENGAFTGEISMSMLASIKVSHVIIGHSERRALFGETDETISKKVRAAMDKGITPILCCGESLEQRKAGEHFSVVNEQVVKGLSSLDSKEVKEVIIAYEPVWAIGTGETASPEQAQEMHAFIRGIILSLHDSDVAQQVRILYGGSVKPANAKELFQQSDIDGGLVGGASLKYDSFKAIISAAE